METPQFAADSSARRCSVYKFRTIQEAVDRVPADKIRECFEEMGKTFAAAKSMAEAAYYTAVELARKDGKVFPPMPPRIIELPQEMEWVDDGKGECVADIVDFCEIRITKDGAGAPTQNPGVHPSPDASAGVGGATRCSRSK